jgi:hypothetical protein
MHYFVERLLYRLSVSGYADNFMKRWDSDGARWK